MASRSAKPSVSIVRVTAEHAELVAAFFRQVWDPSATAEQVRAGRAAETAANPALRGERDAPTWIMISGDEAIGYVTTIPVRVWLASLGTDVEVSWVKGLMVLPKYRNGSAGVLLAREVVRASAGLLALTVQPNVRRLFAGVDFREVGALPSAMRILRPAQVLRALDMDALGLSGVPNVVKTAIRLVQRLRLAALAGLALNMLSGVRRLSSLGSGGLRVTLGEDPEPALLDALWLRVRSEVRAAVVRDAAYLTYRYRGADRDGYTTIAAYGRDGTLTGVAYVKQPRDGVDPRLRGIRIATLSDVVCHPRDASVVRVLARAAEGVARRAGAHAIISTATVPGLDRVLRRMAWVRIPSTFHFSVQDSAANGERFPLALDDWWLTRGDNWSDGGL